MKTVVTHSGGFHADDVFAVAAFQLLLGKENVTVIRTRDEAMIATGDYVVDVGGIYDAAHNRFDHHQLGAPVRENGIPYAGFGLMWKHYGEAICDSKEVAEKIEEKLCQQVDAGDTGVELFSLTTLEIPVISFDGFVQQWRAERDSDENMEGQFLQIVDIIREYITRKITSEKRRLADKRYAEELYAHTDDKLVIVSDRSLSKKFFIDTETVVLVFPEEETVGSNWVALAIPSSEYGFATKVQFPAAWAGLRETELQTVSGISDAVFCHKARFIFVANSKESAIAAAKLAE